MVARARLAAPRPVKQEWNWHTVKSGSVLASNLFGGDRRLEAENFLASGFAVRRAIISKSGWSPLSDVATIWQPSRLKGIQVSPDYGAPFLAATQIFDLRPVPRKWLSLERTSDNLDRFVKQGTILVTCSGSVGRATLAQKNIASILVSHDLLRVSPKDRRLAGWIYAYLRAPTARMIMESAQYGHMIKHLEIEHLEAVPFLRARDAAIEDRCAKFAERIISLRNGALSNVQDAENQIQKHLLQGIVLNENVGVTGFVKSAGSTLFGNRRRFDAFRHNPACSEIDFVLEKNANRMEPISRSGTEVWLPNRFKRVNAEDGFPLVDSSSIFEINPDFRRRISIDGISDRYDGFVQEKWLMMSRSGQVYGLLGSVAMATSNHLSKIITDDIIRLKPGSDIHPGYLHLVLTDEVLGRPRVKALAYGSSIPHIEVEDLKAFLIPRIKAEIEIELGELITSAFRQWAEADSLENDLAQVAENEIQTFLNRSGT